MRGFAAFVFSSVLLVLVLCGAAPAARLMGDVVSVQGDTITAAFPAQVHDNSMMIVLTGEGDSVAGTAISQKCTGVGPCEVTGRLLFVGDTEALLAGKKVYVNALNTTPAPSRTPDPPAVKTSAAPTLPSDLRLYYYAAGQTAGYGTLGLGYERTLRLSRGVGIELDAGAAAVGNVNSTDPNVVRADQLIKSLNGRVRFDFNDKLGFYSGYRWNQAKGDDQHWTDLAKQLEGKEFVAPSAYDNQTVLTQGLEYGVTMRPWGRLALSFGFIPELRADYGTFGVRSQPGYTGELRFGTHQGAVRLRGLKSDGYWQADLGITIR